MSNNLVRPSREVYIGLSRHIEWYAIGSLLIRWWEGEKWFQLFFASHIFMVYPPTSRRPFYLVSEAAGNSVRYVSEYEFVKHAKILKLYKLSFDEETYRNMKVYSEQFAGAPYAFLENAGIVLSKWFNRSTNYWHGEKAQKCSELIIRNAILRLPDVSMSTLKNLVLKYWHREIKTDIDLIGVRDCYEIMESLVVEGVAIPVEVIPKYITTQVLVAPTE